MKKYLALLLLIISTLVITSCGNSAENLPEVEDSTTETEIKIGISPGMKAPGFTLLDGNGQEISLSDYKGKIVFLNFWATTCKFCIDEMPDLEEFYNAHKDEEDFAILGINMTKTWEKKSKDQLVEWFDKEGLTFPVVFDEDGALAARWGARSLPMTFIIDQSGMILDRIMGRTNVQTLEQILEEVRATAE